MTGAGVVGAAVCVGVGVGAAVAVGGVVGVADGVVVVFVPPQPVNINMLTMTTVKIRNVNFFINSILPPLLLRVSRLYFVLILHRYTSSYYEVFN